MLKICGKKYSYLKILIFNNCLASGIFLSDCNKGNIVSVLKKNDKKHLNSYWAISLLPICSKIFKRSKFTEMFGFFIENNLISQHEFCFETGDVAIG